VVGSNGLLSQALDQLTLQEFLELAKAKSLDQQAAATAYQITVLEQDIYKAQLKPQLSAFANLPNYSRSFREIVQPSGTIEFQPIRYNNSFASLYATQVLPSTGGTVFLQTDLQRFDDFENDFTQHNGVPIRLGIQQPLFQFNPWKWRKQIISLQQQEATKKWTYDRETIQLRASSLFFDLLVAYQDLKIAITNQTNNEVLLTIAKERFELGKISENDLLQLSLEKVVSTKNKRAAEQALNRASAALYDYLGLAFDGQVIEPILPDEFPVLEIDDKTAINWALKNNYQLDSYTRLQVEAARDLEKSQKEAGLNIDLMASVGYARNGKALRDVYTNPQQEQLLQLSIQLPLVDWGQEKARIQQQQLNFDLALEQNKRFTNQFINATKNLVDRLQDLQEQLALSKQQQAIAIKRFEITRQSFVLGAISTTELGIAQQEKDFALRAYILTLSNYWTSYFALRQSTLFDFSTGKVIE